MIYTYWDFDGVLNAEAVRGDGFDDEACQYDTERAILEYFIAQQSIEGLNFLLDEPVFTTICNITMTTLPLDMPSTNNLGAGRAIDDERLLELKNSYQTSYPEADEEQVDEFMDVALLKVIHRFVFQKELAKEVAIHNKQLHQVFFKVLTALECKSIPASQRNAYQTDIDVLIYKQPYYESLNQWFGENRDFLLEEDGDTVAHQVDADSTGTSGNGKNYYLLNGKEEWDENNNNACHYLIDDNIDYRQPCLDAKFKFIYAPTSRFAFPSYNGDAFIESQHLAQVLLEALNASNIHKNEWEAVISEFAGEDPDYTQRLLWLVHTEQQFSAITTPDFLEALNQNLETLFIQPPAENGELSRDDTRINNSINRCITKISKIRQVIESGNVIHITEIHDTLKNIIHLSHLDGFKENVLTLIKPVLQQLTEISPIFDELYSDLLLTEYNGSINDNDTETGLDFIQAKHDSYTDLMRDDTEHRLFSRDTGYFNTDCRADKHWININSRSLNSTFDDLEFYHTRKNRTTIQNEQDESAIKEGLIDNIVQNYALQEKHAQFILRYQNQRGILGEAKRKYLKTNPDLKLRTLSYYEERNNRLELTQFLVSENALLGEEHRAETQADRRESLLNEKVTEFKAKLSSGEIDIQIDPRIYFGERFILDINEFGNVKEFVDHKTRHFHHERNILILGAENSSAKSSIFPAVGGVFTTMGAGAAIGGLVGSVVPVIGTAIGLAIGAAIGAVVGLGSLGLGRLGAFISNHFSKKRNEIEIEPNHTVESEGNFKSSYNFIPLNMPKNDSVIQGFHPYNVVGSISCSALDKENDEIVEDLREDIEYKNDIREKPDKDKVKPLSLSPKNGYDISIDSDAEYQYCQALPFDEETSADNSGEEYDKASFSSDDDDLQFKPDW